MATVVHDVPSHVLEKLDKRFVVSEIGDEKHRIEGSRQKLFDRMYDLGYDLTVKSCGHYSTPTRSSCPCEDTCDHDCEEDEEPTCEFTTVLLAAHSYDSFSS